MYMEVAMRHSPCANRLTVIGSRHGVQRFQDSAWEQILHARHLEPLEFSPSRFVCLFQTDAPDLMRLQTLSRRWPGLVLLLDYELRRIKGLARASDGGLEHCEIGY
jgi:hypothetical protein